MPPILILHLSDLHFGKYSRFANEDPKDLGRTLGKDVLTARNLLDAKQSVDLVVVSGDIAESGKPSEFRAGSTFLRELAGSLGLTPSSFVFCPGNHDVSWRACLEQEAAQREEEFDEVELRRRLALVKFSRYNEFLEEFYGGNGVADVARPLGHGAYVYDFDSRQLSVASLNSCERESHRKSDHFGEVSHDQAHALLSFWNDARYREWIKIIVVHHNPDGTVPENVQAWREFVEREGKLEVEALARYETDLVGFSGKEYLRAIVEDCRVQVILHGHQHARNSIPWFWKSNGHAHILATGSWGGNEAQLPKDQPNSLRLLLLNPDRKLIAARSLVYNPHARTHGEVSRGAYVVDTAETEGFLQRLDLPPGYRSRKRTAAKNTRDLPEEVENFISTYRSRFSSHYGKWDLRPVGVVQSGGSGKPIDANLDEMYLPLRLGEGYDINRTEEGAELSPAALLRDHTRVVIRGPAGTGKTTWMRVDIPALA